MITNSLPNFTGRKNLPCQEVNRQNGQNFLVKNAEFKKPGGCEALPGDYPFGFAGGKTTSPDKGRQAGGAALESEKKPGEGRISCFPRASYLTGGYSGRTMSYQTAPPWTLSLTPRFSKPKRL